MSSGTALRPATDQRGFTLVELMITMVMFVLVIVAASNIFSGLLNQFKQQSKVAESNIEGVVGLELLRYDIEQAGYGLPWDLTWNGVSASYSEAVDGSPTTTSKASGFTGVPFNDAPNPPRAFVVGDNISPTGAYDPGLNNSDYLVVKATNVATNSAAHKFTHIVNTGASNSIQLWNKPDDALNTGDQTIVLYIGSSSTQRVLINNGSSAYNTSWATSTSVFNSAFQPIVYSNNVYLIYGLTTSGTPRMPFNRADYYVRTPPSPNMPSRCAPGTGVLYKAVVTNDTSATSGGKLTELPLLDCVADMQVVIGADTTEKGGTVDQFWNGTPSWSTAGTIRKQVRDVRVYILAHEGQRDPAYQFVNQTNSNNKIYTISDPNAGVLNQHGSVGGLDLDAMIVNAGGTSGQYLNFRWKLYTLVVSPYNLAYK